MPLWISDNGFDKRSDDFHIPPRTAFKEPVDVFDLRIAGLPVGVEDRVWRQFQFVYQFGKDIKTRGLPLVFYRHQMSDAIPTFSESCSCVKSFALLAYFTI